MDGWMDAWMETIKKIVARKHLAQKIEIDGSREVGLRTVI